MAVAYTLDNLQIAEGCVLLEKGDDQAYTTSSGLYVPKTDKSHYEGFVTQHNLTEDSEWSEYVNQGDVVIFAEHADYPISLNGKEYRLVNESDILAVLSNAEENTTDGENNS